MERKTIANAIVRVLEADNRAMTANEIYEAIVAGKLYEFNAKEPLGIVRNQLNRHCVGNDHSCASKTKLFRRIDRELYELALDKDESKRR